MKKILIIVPDGGMLFEAAGIADILMQANRLHAEGLTQPRYRIIIATTQPHQVIHGQSGLNLLADYRLPELDPREPLDTIIITGRGMNEQESTAVVDWLHLAAPHARRVASICGGAMLLARPACWTVAARPPTGGCWRRCKPSTRLSKSKAARCIFRMAPSGPLAA